MTEVLSSLFLLFKERGKGFLIELGPESLLLLAAVPGVKATVSGSSTTSLVW